MFVLDFDKTFNTVNHEIFNCSVRGIALERFHL